MCFGRALSLGLVAVAAACQLPHQETVTPQRPTVSFDTATTAPGTFELETGVAIDPGDSFDAPNTLKYGADSRTELLAGWSPWQQVVQPGPDAEGGGDLVIGVRHRLFDAGDGTPSAGLVFRGKLPTASAAAGLASGEVDLRFAGILNQQFGAVNANLFYEYGALGDPTGDGTTSEHTTTLTASTAVSDRVGAFAELAWVTAPAQDRRSVFAIVGTTFAAESWLVFDAGATIGLSDTAPDVQLFVGCTHNLGAPRAVR